MINDPRMDEVPSKVLQRAKEVHNERGHGPAFGENRDGTVCVGYALVEAARELAPRNWMGTWQEARNYVEVKDMSDWNDQIGQRGHARGDCDALFDTAIELAKSCDDIPREDVLLGIGKHENFGEETQ